MREAAPHAKEDHVVYFRVPHCLDPTLRTALFRLTAAPARKKPHGSQSPAPACGCSTADASAGLRHPRSDPRWHPSSCSRWVWQLGPFATCATSYLLLQHLDKNNCSIYLKQMKHLKHMYKTLAKHQKKLQNMCVAIATYAYIKIKHLQHTYENT
jgi:hypothetical protein